MRIAKHRLLEAVPDLSIFLDVDDLKEGKGGEYVRSSEYVLVFCSEGYFSSVNCMRELLSAVWMGKPLIILVDPEERHGGLTSEQVLKQLEEADARYQTKWTDANLLDEVRAWQVEDAAHHLGEAKIMMSRRREWGRELCHRLTLRKPIAKELHALLFEDATKILEWNRLSSFQLVTIRLLAERLCDEPLKERNSPPPDKLKPPDKPTAFHVYVSANNPGALELMIELCRAYNIKYDVTPPKTEARDSAAERVERAAALVAGDTFPKGRKCRARRTDAPSQDVRLLISQEPSDLPRCTHVLLYLTNQTWQSGATSERFAAEMRTALGEPATLSALLPVHEMIGVHSEERNAIDFKYLFKSDDGTTTPSDLVEKGIYSKIALALKGSEWRQQSLANVLCALVSGADPDKEIQRSRSSLMRESLRLRKGVSGRISSIRLHSCKAFSTRSLSASSSKMTQHEPPPAMMQASATSEGVSVSSGEVDEEEGERERARQRAFTRAPYTLTRLKTRTNLVNHFKFVGAELSRKRGGKGAGDGPSNTSTADVSAQSVEVTVHAEGSALARKQWRHACRQLRRHGRGSAPSSGSNSASSSGSTNQAKSLEAEMECGVRPKAVSYSDCI